MKKKIQQLEILVFANIVLTVFLFWTLYSQISYLTQIMEQKASLTIPELKSHTAILVNPITGKFILVPNKLMISTITSLILISLVYYFLFKRSIK